MKKLLWSMAALSLMATGCSKEEMEESVTDGVSAVATPVGGPHARVGESEVWNELWFNHNQGRMWVNAKGPINRLPQNCNPSARVVFGAQGSDDPYEVTVMQADLCRVGNSRNYRSAANSFNFSDDQFFSLVNLDLNWEMADGTPGEYAAQLFLYPSGRTVVQDPKVMRVREQGEDRMRVIIADDPAQEVDQVFHLNESGTRVLEKTHFNQPLGLSSWGILPDTDGDNSVDFHDLDYDNDGLFDLIESIIITGQPSSDTYGEHRHRFEWFEKVWAFVPNHQGNWVAYDEPLIIGSKLTSNNNGGNYTLTVAIADLGQWVDDVRCTFAEGNGPAPIGDTFAMELVGEGAGNLKVYEVSGIRFNGIPSERDRYDLHFTLNGNPRPRQNIIIVKNINVI